MCTLDIVSSLLKEKHLTQKDLCNYLGVTKNAFTNWKSGNNTAYMKHLPKIAEFLNVDVNYLLGKTDIKNPTANNDDGKNVIKIAGRDGSYIEKRLSDEQIEMLKTMINSLPDAPDDL